VTGALIEMDPTNVAIVRGRIAHDFARVWDLIWSSLRPGAWFAGNFFGERESWADNADETFVNEEAARALF
jgi:hypothetical protein